MLNIKIITRLFYHYLKATSCIIFCIFLSNYNVCYGKNRYCKVAVQLVLTCFERTLELE